MLAGFSNTWWIYVILGAFAGIVSGALGLGSGIIFVPALVLLLGFAQKSAQGTALAVMVPMVLVGALRYWTAPDIGVDLRYVALLAAGAVGGALVGTELAQHLPGSTLKKIFALFIIIIAIRMLVSSPGGRARPVTQQAASGGDQAAQIHEEGLHAAN